MGSKNWLIILLLAVVLVAKKSNASQSSDPLIWGLNHRGGDMNSLGIDEEMLMSTGISHRILQQKGRYISYSQLRKNSVPCNRRGVSYYDCRNPKPANPYRRGCSAITLCRRNGN